MNTPTETRRLVPLREAMLTLSQKQTQFYAAINQGLMIKPVKISARRVGFPSDELSVVLSGRIAGLGDDEMRALVARLHDRRKILASELLASGSHGT